MHKSTSTTRVSYNPNLIRRCVRRTNTHIQDGRIDFVTKSFTKSDEETKWTPVVDTQTGMVSCDCPDFHYRHEKHNPNVLTPQHFCKHLVRAVANCERNGDLAKAQPVAAAPVAVLSEEERASIFED